MNVVTLSTLPGHSLAVQETNRPAPRGRAGGGRAAAPAGSILKVRVPEAAPRPVPHPRRPAEAGMKRLDRIEHEARGLLNLVTLLSRCLQGGDGGGSADERQAWRTEVAEANERLEGLYAAGLSRTFLTAPPSTPAAGTALLGAAA